MKEAYCVRWAGEIWTKSEKVRRRAIKLLIKNLRLRKGEYILRRERLFVLKPNYEAKLAKTFGISSWSKGYIVDRDLNVLASIAIKLVERKKPRSFKIETHRMDKSFPYTSLDINRILGEKVLEAFPELKVNLEQPELTIYVEILRDLAFVSDNWHRGLGGLPYGFSGRAVALISGGIDSPVAAWLMMKRGVKLLPLHFRITDVGVEKFEKLVSVLEDYGSFPDYVVVDHRDWLAEAKKILRDHGLERYTCIICKRRMLRKASEYAERFGAKAIILGDSLGQVASQTLASIAAIDEASRLPVLRPLIGMDKEEIITLAKRIGTYEISIIGEAQAQCPFVPKHPIINPDLKRVKQAEEIVLKELGEL
jgi:thiamine biosynthesis protein ThiI